MSRAARPKGKYSHRYSQAADYATYRDCFDPALHRVTARAQSPGYGLDTTRSLGAAVVLAETAGDTISAFATRHDTDAFSCIIAPYKLISAGAPGDSDSYEVIQEPPSATSPPPSESADEGWRSRAANWR